MINEMRIMDIPSKNFEEVFNILKKILWDTYYEIGQNPHEEDVEQMAKTLFIDLRAITQYKTMNLDDVKRAFKNGVRAGNEASVFLNVRTYNIWLRAEKIPVAQKKIQENKEKELQYQENVRLMGATIKKAKQLKINSKISR